MPSAPMTPALPSTAGVAEPMRSRWSPSIFDDQHEVTDAQLELLLSAARWAPSEGNFQPWSFVVLPRGAEGHATLVTHLSRGNSGWVPRASAVVLAGATVAPDPAQAEGRAIDPAHSHYDLGQAVAHLTLQAQAMGLAAHQFSGFDRAAAARDLGVPDHVAIRSGIALGVRGDPQEVSQRDRERELRERVRKPLSALAHHDHWGVAWGDERA